MAFGKCYFFVNFLLFYSLLPKNILINAGGNCLNPTFEKNQKVVIDYFFDADFGGLAGLICQIVLQSNGLISMVYRMSSALKEKNTCMTNASCVTNRYFACNYKKDPDVYNDCNKDMPEIEPSTANCVCRGKSDDILTSNEAARINYGISKLPAMAVNGKYDPCFTNFSAESMKSYFCKAYKNELPLCKN